MQTSWKTWYGCDITGKTTWHKLTQVFPVDCLVQLACQNLRKSSHESWLLCLDVISWKEISSGSISSFMSHCRSWGACVWIQCTLQSSETAFPSQIQWRCVKCSWPTTWNNNGNKLTAPCTSDFRSSSAKRDMKPFPQSQKLTKVCKDLSHHDLAC